MPGATANYAWPYGVGTDSPNGAAQVQAAMVAADASLFVVDGRVGVIEGNYARGRRGNTESITDTAVSTTEAVIISNTFTTVAGRRYKATWDLEYYPTTTAGPNMFMKLRWANSGSPGTGGTIFRAKAPNCVTTAFFTLAATLVGVFTASATGTVTVSATAKTSTSTGGIAGGASDHLFGLIIEDIGL